MSILHSLMTQMETWGKSSSPLTSRFTSTVNYQGTVKPSPPRSVSVKDFQGSRRRKVSKVQPPIIFAVAVVSLTSVVSHRFYNQPQLSVGTNAPQTIFAPESAKVEDSKTTEEKRKATRTGFVPVLTINNQINEKIQQELNKSFEEINRLRETTAFSPFLSTGILSSASQETLLYSSEAVWQEFQEVAKNLSTNPEAGISADVSILSSPLQQAIAELQFYAKSRAEVDFSEVFRQIQQARQAYSQTVKSSQNYAAFLKLSPEEWEQTQTDVRQVIDRILMQGIAPGVPPELLATAIRFQLETVIPQQEVQTSVTTLLLAIIQPNLTENKEKTKLLAEQAAQSVQPEIVEIAQGEVIVEEGEAITQSDFVLLDHFDLSRRGVYWAGIIGSAGLVTGAVGIFLVVQRRVNPRLRCRDYILLLLLSVSAPLLPLVGIPYTSLPAIGLLVSSFYGPALGVTLVSLLTGLTGFSAIGVSSVALGWEYLLAGAAGGLVAATVAGRLRSREELAFLGGAIGITQGSVNLIFNLILSASAGAIWYVILPEAILVGASGIAWSIVALGVSPYLERFFDLLTPTRLAELSNPNRPLLQRLATEAPGTFQHTLFVASLAEAAARELRCNVELVRAGTLYHDIGKMHDAQGFIENQMGKPNKHDAISDPYQSTEIIKKHVSEGLVMAKKYGLPKAIQAFIPEHQGTLLISYFYFKAKERAQKEGRGDVNEADFRYQGPIPQSRETGIVMLADACEAALRSLKDVNPQVATSVVKKVLKARWQDNQLTDSGLRWEELPLIADIFVRVWEQCNHQRIAYPKAALEPRSMRK